MDDYHPTYEPIYSEPAPKKKKPKPISPTPQPKKKKKRAGQSGSQCRRRKRNKLLAIDPHCQYCRCVLTEATATLDHVTPRSKGGTNANANLVLACKHCNSRKSDKPLDDWLGA